MSQDGGRHDTGAAGGSVGFFHEKMRWRTLPDAMDVQERKKKHTVLKRLNWGTRVRQRDSLSGVG
jgi:hypothetical protein